MWTFCVRSVSNWSTKPTWPGAVTPSAMLASFEPLSRQPGKLVHHLSSVLEPDRNFLCQVGSGSRLSFLSRIRFPSRSELLTWDLAEWIERLTANAEVATVLGSILASSDTVESEGRQMKQCWLWYKEKKKKTLLKYFFLLGLDGKDPYNYTVLNRYGFYSKASWCLHKN